MHCIWTAGREGNLHILRCKFIDVDQFPVSRRMDLIFRGGATLTSALCQYGIQCFLGVCPHGPEGDLKATIWQIVIFPENIAEPPQPELEKLEALLRQIVESFNKDPQMSLSNPEQWKTSTSPSIN